MTDRVPEGVSSTAQVARALKVPASRASRFARLGSMASGIAGNVAWQAAGQLTRGTRPDLRKLLIAPGNLHRVAEELARMRGAAMKIGQLVSMDAGEFLPPELANILGRLRDDAHFMPPRQLKAVLNAGWGSDWMRAFAQFDVRPIAAASIGQVHRARLRDGRDMAIKVQYPGVVQSIDSDVSNVGALLRMSGLIPKGFDIAPYLDEARAQLHEETDYLREGQHLQGFGDRLRQDPRFAVPAHHGDWSTQRILAMEYLEGQPIESAESLPQGARDRIATDLIDLMLRELFEFMEMQSDPNFANYRHDPETGCIVLLDFGATRALQPDLVQQYRHLLRAGMSDDTEGLRAAAQRIGLVPDSAASEHTGRILEMIRMVFSALRASGPFDFAETDLPQRMQAEGLALAEAGFVPPPVPMDVLYLQRKFGGLFLLCSRLRARVDVTALLDQYLDQT